MVPFRVQRARPQEDKGNLCKCMGQSHTLLLCTHCLVKKKTKKKNSETQPRLYYNLFSAPDKWWHSSALCPSLIMPVSSLIRQCFNVVPSKKRQIWARSLSCRWCTSFVFFFSPPHMAKQLHLKGHVLWMSKGREKSETCTQAYMRN